MGDQDVGEVERLDVGVGGVDLRLEVVRDGLGMTLAAVRRQRPCVMLTVSQVALQMGRHLL